AGPDHEGHAQAVQDQAELELGEPANPAVPEPERRGLLTSLVREAHACHSGGQSRRSKEPILEDWPCPPSSVARSWPACSVPGRPRRACAASEGAGRSTWCWPVRCVACSSTADWP